MSALLIREDIMKKISKPTEGLIRNCSRDELANEGFIKDSCRKDLHNEMLAALDRVAEEHIQLPAFNYFADVIRSRYERMCGAMEKPSVVVAGTGIPDELMRAAGAAPFYILGGSRAACACSDDRMPRDADPESRSVLGYLYQMEEEDPSGQLILIPLYSDSMRKIAYQLTLAGRKVITVDMPPVQGNSAALEKWKEQVMQAAVAVAEHVHSRITAASLKRAVREAVEARSEMQVFLRTVTCEEGVFSSMARILVQNSYYYADDLAEWTGALGRLRNEIWQTIGRKSDGYRDTARILLMGSPVYFPNDKLPSLFSDAHLKVVRNMDPSTEVFEIIPRIARAGNSAVRILAAVAEEWYRHDVSGAYIRNENLRQKILGLLETGEMEGVVYHILKGQIGPDFELSWFEDLFERADIPVFRLETDYQYQDVEQLRIRMEAFSEMLMQRRFGRRAMLGSAILNNPANCLPTQEEGISENRRKAV